MLGLLLGVAILIVFVFYLSEDTIDAPSIDDDRPATERTSEPP